MMKILQESVDGALTLNGTVFEDKHIRVDRITPDKVGCFFTF
jgi:hypothetical protein